MKNEKAKVLTIGEAMGLFAANEICPLEEVTSFTRYVCGAELNFCVGMSRLEHETAYITQLGNDPLGKAVKNFLLENDIDCRYVFFDETFKTGFQMKAKTDHGDPEVANFRKNTAFCHIEESITDKIDINEYRHLHITGIPLAVSESAYKTVVKLAHKAKENGLSVSFDPNLRPALWKDTKTMADTINGVAKYADIILPGIKEAEILTGTTDTQKIADFYMEKGVKTVVIKDGAKGAYMFDKDGKTFAPSFKVEKVVDTVGAGDGFAVGIVSAILEGIKGKDILTRGNAIGSLAIQTAGDNEGLPTVKHLCDYINKNNPEK